MSESNQNLPESDDQLWTTKRVAKYLHVSHKTVFELRKKGLPFVKLGGAVRFSRTLTSHRLRQIARKGAMS